MLFVTFSDPKFIYDSVRVQFLQVMSIIINNLQTMLKVISDYAKFCEPIGIVLLLISIKPRIEDTLHKVPMVI